MNLAICIQSDDPDLLAPRMIYEVIPDKEAEKSRYVRVIDNEGEDYLYPEAFFLFMDFPKEVKEALLEVGSHGHE